MKSLREIWDSNDEGEWRAALARYWDLLKPENRDLEEEMQRLDLSVIADMSPESWYEFLREKYFRWKYTAANRYATTTASLQKHVVQKGLDDLDAVRQELLSPDAVSLSDRLRSVGQIGGLGPAGASGLLSLLYPETFGTVDQFVVKRLREIEELPEREVLVAMNPESLSRSDAVLLILILQRKARELNTRLDSIEWTPRKVEMVLWAADRE